MTALVPELAVALSVRARRAAEAGEETFALPEGADVAHRLARMAPDEEMRAEATTWADRGFGYHELVRLSARVLLAREALEPSPLAVYVPKVQAELEPALALWPEVLLYPTTAHLPIRELIELRAFAVHPLAVRDAVGWADGRPSSPAEFFFHDLDHARYKVREDVLAMGVTVPDAYRDGTTLDPLTGRHRTILPHVAARLDGETTPWRDATGRHAWLVSLLSSVDGLDPVLSDAVELLLFEIFHEKSHPVDGDVLAREVAGHHHLEKLENKLAIGFFGPDAPKPAVCEALPQALAWLEAQVR